MPYKIHLLSETDLDYEKAIKTALSMETAAKRVTELKNGQQQTPASTVHLTGEL